MRYDTYLCLLLLSLISGCASHVGGECRYETRFGTAQIVESNDTGDLARFKPLSAPFTSGNIPFSPEMKFEVQQTVSAATKSLYPAQLAVITEGSCTPYNFSLLATEQSSGATFLPFNTEGQLSSEVTKNIDQFAAILKKLKPYWPQITLHLCGQTRPEGSEEYNQNLSQHYVTRVVSQLQRVGIPTNMIKAIARGEQLCPDTPQLPDEGANGVWLSFDLEGFYGDGGK